MNHILGIIINGIGLGLALSILLGPVFFALIHTSISKGFREGVTMAFGIVASDATYLTIAFFLANLVDQPIFKKYLGYAGALLLLVYGVYLMITKYAPAGDEKKSETKRWRGPFFKGYMLNLINVNVFFFWLFAISSVQATYDSSFDVVLFFSGTLLTVFLTDVGKAYLSKQLQRWITTHRISFLNRIVGVVLFIFGILMLYHVYIGKNVIDNAALERRINSSIDL